MRTVSYFTLFILFFAACRKDEPTKIVDPPPPPTEYIPTYSPCGTETGEVFAIKSTKRWQAGASCRTVKISGKTYWVVEFTTCSSGALRESITFGAIPDHNPIQKYAFQHWHNGVIAGTLDPRYHILGADGDVLEDTYSIDTTTSVTNFFEIDRWDKANKRAEGHFAFSANIREPRYNPASPKKVAFTSGRFWLNLP